MDLAEQEAFDQALDVLMASPLPDSGAAVELPFPSPFPIFSFAHGAYVMTYTFIPDQSHVLFVLGVVRQPDLP